MPSHSESRIMPYSAAQIYDLVSDVARYPEFLPWNSAARVRSRRAGEVAGTEILEADLVISFKLFREKFGSRVVLTPKSAVEVVYLDGPFKYLNSGWRFQDRPEGGADVQFHVDFEFRNAILQGVIGLVFDEAMRRIVRAFEARAEALYGKNPQA